MKFSNISVLLLTLISSSAFAGSIAEGLEPIGSEISGNGGCWAYPYVMSEYTYAKASKEFVKDSKKRYSEPNLFFRWSDITIEASNMANGEGSDLFFSRIDSLLKKKKVTAMFGAGPGENCEESEYCSLFNFAIYFKDGSVLTCDFDQTT